MFDTFKTGDLWELIKRCDQVLRELHRCQVKDLPLMPDTYIRTANIIQAVKIEAEKSFMARHNLIVAGDTVTRIAGPR